jgi:phage terminase small subunit
MPAKKKTPQRVKAGTSKASAAEKRAIFIESYFANGENGTQAAIAAGFAANSAGVTAAKLLKDPRVLAEISRRREELCSNLKVTTERILKERARMAFFDPRKLFDSTGNPIPINELDDDTAAALAGLDVTEEFEGQGKDRKFIGYTKKYKLADKGASLTALEKIKGMYAADNKQVGEAAVAAVVAVSKALDFGAIRERARRAASE